MIPPGIFDQQDRLHKIDKNGDPQVKINETVTWELIRSGIQAQRSGKLLLRTIGRARARAKIGWHNLLYNIDRMGMLLAASR